jgi:hypothetical protein
MAAKKAAPKSRTSSNKGKSSLKWWYIVPILLVVVLAGYLIVRYSNASGTFAVRNAKQITGDGMSITKSTGVQYKIIPSKSSVYVDYSGNTVGKASQACAHVSFTNVNGSQGAAKLELIAPATGYVMSSKALSLGDKRTANICVSVPVYNQGDYAPPVKLKLSSYGAGTVSVSSMYLKQ